MRCPVCECLIDPHYFEENCPECNAPLYEDLDDYPCCDEFEEEGLFTKEQLEDLDDDDYNPLPSEEELEDFEDEEED